MGDHGRDVNAGIHAGRVRKAPVKAV
jgi:hypothetical protein